MYPFSFQNPTRIEFGLDKEKEMGKYMHEYGAKKALIIYGSERVKHSVYLKMWRKACVSMELNTLNVVG